MSELYYQLHQRPCALQGNSPIQTKGNWFWQRGKRFLIKGVSYNPVKPGCKPWDSDALIDPLSEEWLSELRRDIPYLQQLGTNTISITHYDPTARHDRALALLRDEGIHVLIQLLGNLRDVLPDLHKDGKEALEKLQPSDLYTLDLISPALKTITQTHHFPNILGYQLSAGRLNTAPTIKFASLLRAAIRDCKHHLHSLPHSHKPPIGITVPDLLMYRKPSLHFYTAGPTHERADFFAFDCYSWAGEHSSFQISGWKNWIQQLQEVPVPMFFSSYGTAIYKPRKFTETDCLYSPDMTGTVSGGFVYTWMREEERGSMTNAYPLVDLGRGGERVRKEDFWFLKVRFDLVDKASEDEVFGDHEVKDYEGWRGDFPEKTQRFPAGAEDIPPFPGNWESVLKDLVIEHPRP